MPRRIIYLKNPTQGSHFRTIGGEGGGGGNRPPRNRRPGTPRPLPPTTTLTGGAIYNNAPSNWFIGEEDPYTPSPFGELPGYGVGPYEQEFTQGWVAPESLAAQLWYIIVYSIEPETGALIPGAGDPGYMGFLEGSSLDMSPNLWTYGPPTPGDPRVPQSSLWNPFD